MKSTYSALGYAEEGEWDLLLREINLNPSSSTEVDAFGMLPLHWACTEADLPTEVLNALVKTFPEGCIYRNQSDMLPLHVAINSRLSTAHLEILVSAYPTSIYELSADGKNALQLGKLKFLPPDSLRLLEGNSRRKFNVLSRDFDGGIRELSVNLHKILIELQQIDMEIKSNSTRSICSSTSSDYSSQLSQHSILCQPTCQPIVRIRWNPKQPLGITFKPLRETLGAQLSRLTGKGQTPGINSLEVGDVLSHLNGKPVKSVHFTQIMEELKTCRKTVTLVFTRPNCTVNNDYEVSCSEPQDPSRCSSSSSANSLSQIEADHAVYSRMSDLLIETMGKISRVEEYIQAISPCYNGEK